MYLSTGSCQEDEEKRRRNGRGGSETETVWGEKDKEEREDRRVDGEEQGGGIGEKAR